MSTAPVVLSADEKTLLAGCRAGDNAAWLTLFRAYSSDVGSFLRGMLRRSDVDDLVQQVFLSFLSSLERFRGEASIRTWLLRIARNTALHEIRTTSRRRKHLRAYAESVEPVEPGPEGRVHARARLQQITELVATLDETFREVWVLREVGHCSVAEAAAVLEIPEATVRSRHYRARVKLFERLAALESRAPTLRVVPGGDS